MSMTEIIMERDALKQQLTDCKKQLARQLASANVLIAEQNKLGKERQEWALHTNEVIRSLNQQLVAALAACKLKDEALEGLIDTMDLRLDDDDLSLETRTAFEALAIQPDDSALKTWLGEPEWFYRKDANGVNIFYRDIEERPKGCTPLYSTPRKERNDISEVTLK